MSAVVKSEALTKIKKSSQAIKKGQERPSVVTKATPADSQLDRIRMSTKKVKIEEKKLRARKNAPNKKRANKKIKPSSFFDDEAEEGADDEEEEVTIRGK